MKSFDPEYINDALDRARDQMHRPQTYAGSGELVAEKPAYGYAGSGTVGRSAVVTEAIDALDTVNKQWGGAVSKNDIRISNWLGLYTRPSRPTSPLGALEDCANFNFNSEPTSMSLRTGSTSYYTAPTDISGDIALTTINNAFHISTESPVATNIDIVCGQTAGSSKYVFQRKFFHSSATATDSWVRWGEYLTDITISDAVSGTSVVFVGGETTANYYKGWMVYNATKGDYSWVTASSKTDTKTTLTLCEDTPTDWVATNALTLYRHFHDNPNFSVLMTYSTVSGRPPIALQQGNGILFSGGMGTSTGLKPVWSGYLSKTFFEGSTGYTGGIAYQETYVTEAEVKDSNSITVSTGSTSSDSPNLSDGRWFFCIVPETDDGQRGIPVYASTKYVDCTSDKFSFTVTVSPGLLNKRLRYLNVFLGIAPNEGDATIDWGFLYYIERLDLCGSDWTWTKSADATGTFVATCTMDGDKWNNKASESLAQHLGHTLNTSSTCSFSVGQFVNNRLFVGKYYDYVDAVEYLDQIRYTPFGSNGIGQLNKLANLDSQTQSTIEQGDATSVQKLLRWEDKLVILKDNSSYFIPISGDTSQWQLITISNHIGCKNPDTAIETPFMLMWCQSAEDVYGWTGASPFSLAQNWLDTYKALDLTTKASVAWYDNKLKTYNFSYNDTLGYWYSMYFECPIGDQFKWGKHQFGNSAAATTTLNITSAGTRGGVVYLNAVYMATSSAHILYFDSTVALDINIIKIAPYFKTCEFTLDEEALMRIKKIYLTLSPTGGTGTLSAKITVGTNTQTYANMTKTLSLIARGINFTYKGRKVQFEYNMNSTMATNTALKIYELRYDYELIPFIGDKTITG